MAVTVKGLFMTARYLFQLEAERIPCTIFLMNGFQMHGVILIEHDGESILMEANGKQQVVFRQAISTIAPSRPVRLEVKRIESGEKHIRRSYEHIDGGSLIVEADVHTDESGQRVIKNLTQHPDDEGGGSDG